MFVVVEIVGKQFCVDKGAMVKVLFLDVEEGIKYSFGDVLLVLGDGKIEVGQFYVDGVFVEVIVFGYGKDEKVVVFKMKWCKNYCCCNGHCQQFIEFQIDDIVVFNQGNSIWFIKKVLVVCEMVGIVMYNVQV